MDGPAGMVIKIVFRYHVRSAEAESICATYGSLHRVSLKENSFFLYLKSGLSIERVERITAKLKKNRTKIKDAILM